jgi:predicted permease
MSAFRTSDVRFLVPQAGGVLATGSAAIMTVVGVVLLIACANVTGMLLARASARRREISVRLAIGASRWDLVRQMLAEGLALGLIGAAVAAGVAWAIIRLLGSIRLPIESMPALDLRLDLRVMTFAIGIAAIAGLLAALTPALKSSSLGLASALRGDIPSTRIAGDRWALRDVLVVSQLALTVVLLVIAGLLLRSLSAARSADVGFRADGLALLSADTNMVRYPPERREQFWAAALERVRGLPGVESAALVAPRVPFDINYNQTSILIDGKADGTDERGDTVMNVSVTPGYFETLGIPLVEGRDFSPADVKGGPLVAVVNQTMAQRYWPDGSAIGRTFRFALSSDQRFQIIGVVADHRVRAIAERPVPYVHFAAAQRPVAYNYVVARTRGDASQLLAIMRRELLSIEPGLVFLGSSTMNAWIATSLLPQRVAAMLAAAFGGLGTLLAAIGLYGVIAFSVTRRTREIGVRMAVGADARNVRRMVMQQGLGLAAIGAGLGVMFASIAARFLSGMLYGVASYDLFAWTAALTVLFTASALANFIPARRAMRVDPVTALRTE